MTYRTANMRIMARTPKKISDFDVKLGEAVKHRRLHPDVKMSQTALADASGIPLSNLQRREDGSNEITVSELERIAAAIRTTPLSLVQEALNRYGGLEKLIQEHAVSEPSPSVEDIDNVTYLGRKEVPLGAAADKKPRRGPKD